MNGPALVSKSTVFCLVAGLAICASAETPAKDTPNSMRYGVSDQTMPTNRPGVSNETGRTGIDYGRDGKIATNSPSAKDSARRTTVGSMPGGAEDTSDNDPNTVGSMPGMGGGRSDSGSASGTVPGMGGGRTESDIEGSGK